MAHRPGVGDALGWVTMKASPDPRGTLSPEVAGPLLFARFAYPPNELGYCGSEDHRTLLEYGAAQVVDPGIRELAKGFSGAWPYLQFIATETGIGDPLDTRVVEAYWIGSPLLEGLDVTALGNSLRDRFAPRAGASWKYLEETIPAKALPHHSFHVLGVYPWVGLLNGDLGDHPLRILDRCRIRWGRVVADLGEKLVVSSRPLEWDGRSLSLGAEIEELAVTTLEGYGFVSGFSPGEWVALHWDWVCDRLDRRQLANLQRYTNTHLSIANHGLAHPGPATVLG
ncbi:MAG: DUF6390 family protein [Acidimicrobiia bacterium]|nr:DUF6390 family protein [Acidimicrobiia bacterium]